MGFLSAGNCCTRSAKRLSSGEKAAVLATAPLARLPTKEAVFGLTSILNPVRRFLPCAVFSMSPVAPDAAVMPTPNRPTAPAIPPTKLLGIHDSMMSCAASVRSLTRSTPSLLMKSQPAASSSQLRPSTTAVAVFSTPDAAPTAPPTAASFTAVAAVPTADINAFFGAAS